MPSPCMYSRARRQGATLLELLAATAIAALILSVLFAVYFAVIQTTGRQADGRGSAAAAEALDMLAHDFMCAMIPVGITNPPLELTEATNALPGALCRFYTAEPFSAELGPQHAVRAVQVQLLPDHPPTLTSWNESPPPARRSGQRRSRPRDLRPFTP